MPTSPKTLATPIAILVILAAAATIRIDHLGDVPLWTDEALTLVLVEGSFHQLWFTPFDPTPPVYYSLHKLIFQGDIPNAYFTRLPSVVYGVISVGLVLILGWLANSRMTGLLAASFLAVQTYHVIYSQEARAYSLLFMVILASAVALTLVLRRGVTEPVGGPDPTDRIRLKWLVVYALIVVLAHYTHYISVYWTAFSFAGLVLWESWLAPPERRPNLWSQYLKIGIAIAVVTVPALLFATIISGGWNWLTHASFSTFILTMRRAFFLEELHQPLLDIGMVALVAVGLVRAWRLRAPVAPVLTALLLAPLAMWLTGFVRPVMIDRTILFSVIGIVVCLALAVDALPRIWMRIPVALLIVGAYGANTGLFIKDDLNGNRGQDWMGVAKVLADNAKPGDPIVLCHSWYYPALRHMLGNNVAERPIYSMENGVLYRFNKPEMADTPWTTRYTRHWLGDKAPFVEPASVLGQYPVVWGVRLRCTGSVRADYDRIITGIPATVPRSWAGRILSVDRIQRIEP